MNHEQINFLHHHPGSPVHQHNKSETLTKMQNIVYMYQQAAPAFENSSPTLLSLGSSDDSSCDSSSILSLPVSSSSNSTSNQAQDTMTKTIMQIGGESKGISVRTEPKPKPHHCLQCIKSFSSKHLLVQHSRVHTGEKPYKCAICDLNFKQLSHVHQHTRKVHTGEKPYRCTLCERRFKQLSHLQQHTRLHTGERPYKCHIPECGRTFIQMSNLQQHLRSHESPAEALKNRPFLCDICRKGFATESSLITHSAKHQNGPKPNNNPDAPGTGGPDKTLNSNKKNKRDRLAGVGEERPSHSVIQQHHHPNHHQTINLHQQHHIIHHHLPQHFLSQPLFPQNLLPQHPLPQHHLSQHPQPHHRPAAVKMEQSGAP